MMETRTGTRNTVAELLTCTPFQRSDDIKTLWSALSRVQRAIDESFHLGQTMSNDPGSRQASLFGIEDLILSALLALCHADQAVRELLRGHPAFRKARVRCLRSVPADRDEDKSSGPSEILLG
jgi:hypothetical protein